MAKRNHVLPVLGEILRPIMKHGEDIIGAVLGVHAPFLKEVAVAPRPLLEVPLVSRLYVVGVDVDEAVPVRPGVLMHKPEAVEDLMDRGHHAVRETVAEKWQRKYVVFNRDVR